MYDVSETDPVPLLHLIIQQQMNLPNQFANFEHECRLKFDHLETLIKQQQQQQHTYSEIPVIWKFQKISNEKDLIAFEAEIGNNHCFRAECITNFVQTLGKMVGDTAKIRKDCALLLDREIFANEFWTYTAWTGGRVSRKRKSISGNTPKHANKFDSLDILAAKKFAFSTHIEFIEFFKQTIKAMTSSTLTNDEMKNFVQERSKNSFYEPKTNRKPSSKQN